MSTLRELENLTLQLLYRRFKSENRSSVSLTSLSDQLGVSLTEMDFACKALKDRQSIDYATHTTQPNQPPDWAKISLTYNGIHEIEEALFYATGPRYQILSESTKPSCFMIMRLNCRYSSLIYNKVYKPAMLHCNFQPCRIDLNHRGKPLNSAIWMEIETASAVIADLTYSRPNCYAEVGYTIGLRKEHMLILAAREDYNPRMQPRKKYDPKVHFDLDAYYIEFYNRKNLKPLFKYVCDRLAECCHQITASSKPPVKVNMPALDNNWLSQLRN